MASKQKLNAAMPTLSPAFNNLRSPSLYVCFRSSLPGPTAILKRRTAPILPSFTLHFKRETFISHGNTAKLAKEYGGQKLAQICRTITSDEKCREITYSKIVEKLFELDPDDTVLALVNMMKKKIAMPALLMVDGQDDNLFEHYSSVAQRVGVYTAKDYADILEFLVGRWQVEKFTGLSARGKKSTRFCVWIDSEDHRRIEERAQRRAKPTSNIPFSWIFNRDMEV